jgi:hypothetical protein
MRLIRFATVGLGVTLGCIVSGAAAGVLCAGLLGLTTVGPRALFEGVELYGLAAIIGGICGFVVGPLAAFGFLRRVPLGRLFIETALGATLGGFLGLVFHVGFPTFLGVAVGGFGLAVAHLASRYRTTRESPDRAFAITME